jgi:hypothetical protein
LNRRKIDDFLGENKGIESPKSNYKRNKKIKIISQFDNHHSLPQNKPIEMDKVDFQNQSYFNNKEYSFEKRSNKRKDKTSIFIQKNSTLKLLESELPSHSDNSVKLENPKKLKYPNQFTENQKKEEIGSVSSLNENIPQQSSAENKNDNAENCLQPDESIMEIVIQNFEQANQKLQLKEMLSKECIDSVHTKSRRETLKKTKK